MICGLSSIKKLKDELQKLMGGTVGYVLDADVTRSSLPHTIGIVDKTSLNIASNPSLFKCFSEIICNGTQIFESIAYLLLSIITKQKRSLVPAAV